jgi:hypothetical protein
MSRTKAKQPRQIRASRDDEGQSRLFVEKAREIGAVEDQSRADQLIERLAKKPPEPRKREK